ncbi:MAG: right-handed parallel beta-helix repeat-containing protein, partial [Acidobacteria bacterium]|nr:right-handed parallel beta-helix repeat-containing protein [Acidobacteriota bacterium]
MANLTIDGASQTAFSGDTNLAGPEIVINGEQLNALAHGLVVDGSLSSVTKCVINDLVIQGFPGDGIRVVGGFFTSDMTIARSHLGTNATGTAAVPNAGDGIHLGSSATRTRILGNLISGNTGYGVYAGLSSGDNRIESNIIGGDASGGQGLGNGLGGIYLGSQFNSVGLNPFQYDAAMTETDDPPMRSRAIGRGESKQPSVGILPYDPLFYANIIVFNDGPGVVLDGAGAANNLIYDNIIRSNVGEGVLLTSTASAGNTITGNSIALNGALGIDLGGTTAGGDGVTLNDSTSGAGPNELADYPIITSAVYDGFKNKTTIEGTYLDLNYVSQLVRIEVFSNHTPDTTPNPDPLLGPFGEGDLFLGSFDVFMTGATDTWRYVHDGDLSGKFATATATLPSGSTSEFSEAVLIQLLDVGIVKTGPASVTAGQPMTYTLTVTNYGPVTGGAVTVTDSLPTGVGFTSVSFSSSTSNSWSCGETGGIVTCSALDMDDLEV